MTGRGLGFLVLAGLVYLAANQTRVGWLYIVTAWMVAVVLLSWVLPVVWVAPLRLERRLRPPEGGGELREGDTAVVEVTARAQGPLGGYLVQVTDFVPFAAPDRRRQRLFFTGVGSGAVVQAYQVECWRRGRFQLSPLRVESRGLFGLFTAARTQVAPAEVTVRPWYLDPAGPRPAPAELAPETESAAAGGGVDVIGTREYRAGDPLRAIHWRTSARRGQLVTKQFAREVEDSLWIVLDITQMYGQGRESTLEHSVKVAASLARYGEAAGKALRLVSGDLRRPLTTWPEILEYLTTVEADPRVASAADLLVAVKPGSGVVVVAAAHPPASLPARLGAGVSLFGTRFNGLPGLSVDAWPSGITPLDWWAAEAPAQAVQRALTAIEAPSGTAWGRSSGRRYGGRPTLAP